jgi:hypothetical protein
LPIDQNVSGKNHGLRAFPRGKHATIGEQFVESGFQKTLLAWQLLASS